jgi:hypothetical protein
MMVVEERIIIKGFYLREIKSFFRMIDLMRF